MPRESLGTLPDTYCKHCNTQGLKITGHRKLKNGEKTPKVQCPLCLWKVPFDKRPPAFPESDPNGVLRGRRERLRSGKALPGDLSDTRTKRAWMEIPESGYISGDYLNRGVNPNCFDPYCRAGRPKLTKMKIYDDRVIFRCGNRANVEELLGCGRCVTLYRVPRNDGTEVLAFDKKSKFKEPKVKRDKSALPYYTPKCNRCFNRRFTKVDTTKPDMLAFMCPTCYRVIDIPKKLYQTHITTTEGVRENSLPLSDYSKNKRTAELFDRYRRLLDKPSLLNLSETPGLSYWDDVRSYVSLFDMDLRDPELRSQEASPLYGDNWHRNKPVNTEYK